MNSINTTCFQAELTQYKTIILANGEFPTHPLAIKFLEQAEYIICCDGAAEKLLNFEIHPDVVVGDFDSMSPSMKQQLEPLMFRDASEDYNDLQKAIHYALSKHFQSVAVLGAFGLREDHALANLAIAEMYAPQLSLILVSNCGMFSAITRHTTFASFPKQPVSVFSLKGKAIFTFHGLKYPVQKRRFVYHWEGSLNSALTSQFRIELEGADATALVYRAFL